MTRGGARRRSETPQRRCIVTGRSGETTDLVRFVLSPDGAVTPDLAERLPGRGAWVRAERDILAQAIRRNAFSRAFRTAAKADPALVETVAQGLTARLVAAIGLARRAGSAICGFDKVRARLRAAGSGGGAVGLLLQACDGSVDQRAKLAALAGDAPAMAVLTGSELGLAFGRESVIHASFDVGGATDAVIREALRAAGFRDAEIGYRASDET
jgi:predicted RNA-binding protein YlxR (DUF448 family)